MMGTRNSFTFTWILAISLLALHTANSETVNDEDKCEKKSPCVCEFNNNFVLDVTTVGSEAFLNATVDYQNITYNYYFLGCTDKVLPISLPNTTNLCDKTKNAICFHETNKHLISSLGNQENIFFKNTIDDPKSHDLVISNNKTTTTIQLVCSPELIHDSLFAFPPNADFTQHRLVLLSHKVCRHAVDHGIGTGSTILILLVVGFTVYFVGGALALHFLRGANGLEMIPNLDFWRDLPNLCRDGFLYLISGCKTTQVSTAETYDRI